MPAEQCSYAGNVLQGMLCLWSIRNSANKLFGLFPELGWEQPSITWATLPVHAPGKRNTPQMRRQHLTLRTRLKRLVRKTICLLQIHPAAPDTVIRLFIHRYEFGLSVWPLKARSVTPPEKEQALPVSP